MPCARHPSGRPRRARSSRSTGAAFSNSPQSRLGQHPHHLELVAVRVLAVDALGGAVAGLAGVGVEVHQGVPGLLELLDGVDLPGQVVEPERAAGRAAARRPRTGRGRGGCPTGAGAGTRRSRGLPRHDRHPEGLLVEGDAALEVADEQHGVVEADGVDGHGGASFRWSVGWCRSGGDAEAAGPGDLLVGGEGDLQEAEGLELAGPLERAGVDGLQAAGGDDAGQSDLASASSPAMSTVVVRGRRCPRRGCRRRWC